MAKLDDPFRKVGFTTSMPLASRGVLFVSSTVMDLDFFRDRFRRFDDAVGVRHLWQDAPAPRAGLFELYEQLVRCLTDCRGRRLVISCGRSDRGG